MGIKKALLSSFLVLSLFFGASKPAYAVDPRLKALGTVALYGTVGGALLGVASLAFGASGRAVAKGASLGLYAGLLFGGYIVYSHYLRTRKQQADGGVYPEDAESPYNEYEGEGEYGEAEEPAQRWNPNLFHQKLFDKGLERIKGGQVSPIEAPVQFQLIKIEF